MESYLSFLSPRASKRTLSEILQDYRQHNAEQSGEGVVTRRQAKEAASQSAAVQNVLPSPEVPTVAANDTIDTNEHNTDVSLPSTSQTEDKPESPVANDKEGDVQDETTETETETQASGANKGDESELYSQDTLIAQNSDLKAYAIQTHFRRMKNFM
jgi:hypothetical protein